MAQLMNDLIRTLNTPQLRWLDPWISLNRIRIRKGVNILTCIPDRSKENVKTDVKKGVPPYHLDVKTEIST